MPSPLISIVVPCRDEEKYIKDTILSIMDQDGKNEHFDIEALIVDGKSRDNTASIVKKMSQENNRIKLLINEKKTTPAALNLGVKNASGSYVSIVGAHSRINKDYIKNCLQIIQDKNVDNTGGPQNAKGTGYIGKAIALAHKNPLFFGMANSHNMDYEGFTDTVWGGFYKKDIFNNIGLFDEELIRNQDDELNYRLIKNGGRIWQSKSIKYSYVCRSSIKGLFLQYLQYGYWKAHVIKKHGKPVKLRHIIPGIFTGTLIVLAGLAMFSAIIARAFFALFALYIGFVLLVSLIASLRRGQVRFLPVLPIINASMHFGYGIGFLINTFTSPKEPGNFFMYNECIKKAVSALKKEHVFSLKNKKVLGIGTGSGQWLWDLKKWGAEERNLSAIDLNEDLIKNVKSKFPTADIRGGNAEVLPWRRNTFDLIIQSTVFTSILDDKTKKTAAKEMTRVLKANGMILWYDFFYNNPMNPSVRGIKKNEIKHLFPNCRIKFKRITLAPPITRFLAPKSLFLCRILQRLSIFNTHYLAIIKP